LAETNAAPLQVVGPVTDQASAAKLAKVRLISINKLQVEAEAGVYTLRLSITFQNNNARALKLRHGSFQTQAVAERQLDAQSEREVATLDIGEGVLAELTLPGTRDRKTKGATTAELTVTLGPKDDATVERMVSLWNLVGNAENQITLVCKGTVELGHELSKGWVFEPGRIFEVQLRFEPKVQRRVLFQ
jgi:hypothetical protein